MKNLKKKSVALAIVVCILMSLFIVPVMAEENEDILNHIVKSIRISTSAEEYKSLSDEEIKSSLQLEPLEGERRAGCPYCGGSMISRFETVHEPYSIRCSKKVYETKDCMVCYYSTPSTLYSSQQCWDHG